MLEFNLAQYLADSGKYTHEELCALLVQAEQDLSVLARPLDAEALVPHAVRATVWRAGQALSRAERGAYSDDVEFFMQELQEKADTIGAIGSVDDIARCPAGVCAVSQGFFGDVQLTTGIAAQPSVFLELARRYSGERFSEVDALAIDSMQEFLNVINGMCAIAFARKGIAVDLALPRHGCRLTAVASCPLCPKILTSYGSFHLVLAADEFII